jgi:site-specific DNA-methyltransferase (adenine-specific)
MEYMAGLPDKAFDLAIVDPPYGIGMDGGNVGYKGANDFAKKDWDKAIPKPEYFFELARVSKNQVIWGGNYFPLPTSRCFIIWDKGEGFYNRTYAECEMAWTSFDKNAKIFKRDPLAKGDYHGKIHPTQKPVALYKWLLHNYAKEGDKILDTHLGSGSSAIAAHNMGFDFVGCELDKDYYEAACKRFKEQTAQLTLL